MPVSKCRIAATLLTKCAVRSSVSALAIVSSSAFAQVLPDVAALPQYSNVDENGVDLVLGTIRLSTLDLSIGAADGTGLERRSETISGGAFSSFRNQNQYYGGLSIVGNKASVTIDSKSEHFSKSGNIFTSSQGNGSTLTYNGSTKIYTYTQKSGLIVTLDANQLIDLPGATATPTSAATAVKFQYPDGRIVNVHYLRDEYRIEATLQSGFVGRIQSITNNAGYQLKFSYPSDDLVIDMVGAGDGSRIPNPPALAPTKVQAINNAVDYCAPMANACTGLTQAWPAVSYAYPPYMQTTTDALGRVTRYTFNASGRLSAIKKPSSTVDTIAIGYDANGRVSSYSNGIGTWGYNFALSGATMTATVTDPLSHQRVVISNINVGRPTSDKDALNRTTSFQYDANGRITRITRPEGNYTSYAYDARGNVITTTQVSKTPGTPADIVTTAGYDATCSNPRTCNQPNWTRDARGNQTDYVYDAAHGGILTVTSPASAAGAPRAQTRYGYTALQAYYKNAAGTIVASGAPISRLTGLSSCQTGTSCVGATDEVKVAIAYGTAGVANNLLPTAHSTGAGDGSLTATIGLGYDHIGNTITVDGPLAGTGDTTRYRYDAGRQLVGVVSPDPDGAGLAIHRAERYGYNLDGQVTSVETGTVTNQSDPAWAAFSTAETLVTTYDVAGRKTRGTLSAGSTVHAVTQYSYDNASRLDCTAVRMNSATFGALPASACTAATAGSAGPDRITKNEYNNADQLITVTNAYGVSGQQRNEVTITYTSNGKQASVKDGENNLTTYIYDGHDRAVRTEYPSTTKGAGASNAGDYEQLGYDPNGNVTSRRLRDGTSIGYGYDNLNRLISKDLPGSEPDATYSYDLLGRMTAANQGGNSLGFGYDALGRNLTQSSWSGTLSASYDAGGRRTSLTYPGGGLTVGYSYDATGAMTEIRENPATSNALLASFGYDNLGRRTSLTRGNGTVTSYTHDPVSRLSSMAQDLAGSAQDLTLGFSYNPASQIASTTRSNDSYAWTQHYNVDRSYTSNGLNQYSAAGSTSIGYDARGNLTSSGSSSYSYSSENQLLTAPGGATLAYDPLGRLYFAGISAPWTYLGYDGERQVAEYDSWGGALRRYVHGPGVDEPLVWYEGAGTSDKRWLHTDERGSVIAVSNGAGAITNINSYDEYGIPASGNIGRFGYTGQAWISELGMWYYKSRIYSPTLGRFMQTDPIGYGDGMNLYAYVGSDPLNNVDPNGLQALPQECQGSSWEHYCDDIVVNGQHPDYVTIDPSYPLPTNQPGIGGDDYANEEIVVTAIRTDLKQCLGAIGKAGLEGFIDPMSIAAGAGKSIYEARERIGDGDYGRRLDGSRFPRTWSHAARLGMRRFIPGYLQASLVVGGVKAAFELFSNPSCGLSK